MRNSSLVESLCADNVTGLRYPPKQRNTQVLVGERSVGRRRCTERYAGGIRSENVGMSSEKTCENHVRRKSKDSRGRLVLPGEVGT